MPLVPRRSRIRAPPPPPDGTETSMTETAETPIHLQGRDAVVAAADPEHWREGEPDYHFSRTLMPAQRTHTWAADSLEGIVESIVQVFEMEVSHKKDPATWGSMVTEHFRTNV